MMIEIQNYIDGQFVPPSSERFLENINPATNQVYSKVPDSSPLDVDRAVSAAKRAFPEWKRLKVEERAKMLDRLSDLIKKNHERLARAESIDTGKPIRLAREVDIERSHINLAYYAKEVVNFKSVPFDSTGRGKNTVHFSPLGVVGVISPWNLPLYLLTWKVAPALAVGNTVVAKPSEVTPMTAYLFSELCIEAGLPDGVLNIVHGLGPVVGDRLTRHPDVQAVSFTGSTATGKLIAKNSGAHLKRYSLEMGGKNPNIIFDDCDLDGAVETTLRSAFANQGQVCLCGSRILIQKGIYEVFKKKLLERAQNLVQGDPLDEGTQQGAVVSKQQYEKVLSYLNLARQSGGRCLLGGGVAHVGGENVDGFFIQPTLYEGIPNEHPVNQEEIFGPFATLNSFENEEEAIRLANQTSYGLSASVWTQDKEKAQRVAEKIDAGVVWINTWMLRDLRLPFGGIKDSGRGREGGRWGLSFFSEVKNICSSEELERE